MSCRIDDVIIVGGGLAGLFCALKLAPRPVTVITSAPLGEGASSAWAQGGIAAAVGEGDTPQAHARDTVEAGAGLVDEAVALAMAREASARVHDLLAYGVPFDRDLEGRLAVSREAAHSAHRIVRVNGDTAGRAIMAALIEAVRRASHIRVLEGFRAQALNVSDGAVTALQVASAERRLTLAARAVVLATGGIGHLYGVTTNPSEACGSGLAIAARAGAVIADSEFVQFHPTAIDVGLDPAPLATEALRGEGALLVNGRGERFMSRLHAAGELAPRDIVARGVFSEIAEKRGAFLDARAALGDTFAQRFPTVYASCIAAGIDPVREPIPVAPAAHYHMGGIATDPRGRSSIAGLWAVGEVASTGVHGANRLASNSLLEAVVFAARAAGDIAAASPRHPCANAAVEERVEDGAETASEVRALRTLMSAKVGVVRNRAGLAEALSAIERLSRETACADFANMANAALLVAAAAWRRKESRGAHFRSDFPQPAGGPARRTHLTLQDARATIRLAQDDHAHVW